MAMDTGSPSPRSDRARPRLWMVFAAVGVTALALALLGLTWLRLYDDQLLRQTEGELIAQGVVLAEAYRAAVTARAPPADFGAPRTEAWPFPVTADGLQPVLPRLRASDPVLAAPGDAPAAAEPADALSRAAAESVAELVRKTGRSTLAGIRVLDARGVTVASSGGGLGATYADREEVRAALRGSPSSVLRERLRDPQDAPLESLSRNTGVRVSVVVPVLEGDRVLGAVLLSRTPTTLAKAIWADRWSFTSTGLVLLAVVGLVSLVAAALVLRPLRAVVAQAKAIGAGDAAGSQAIRSPVVAEFDQLSQALATMSAALRDRNEYIRSFAANVSHEFKTPLSSIQGAVELLRDDADSMPPAQRAKFLANIDADSRRLTELVKRLLELARADSMAPGGETSSVEAVLREVVERGKAQGIEVELEGSPGSRVAVPPDVLDAAVWQLVSNAAQHGGTGVQVRVSASAAPAAAVRISVRDDGPGISEANRARVFDAFFTTARERGGTGLGLTIAQSMLRVFGARLELAPPGAGGTELIVTAPLVR
ncbi:MAG TPA: HAMP domain-containing sensor histidine kinase [Myxococcales bacterium]|nr:HAMP domain-containing sensor histidine kinase [Myxococcales bacterium]